MFCRWCVDRKMKRNGNTCVCLRTQCSLPWEFGKNDSHTSHTKPNQTMAAVDFRNKFQLRSRWSYFLKGKENFSLSGKCWAHEVKRNINRSTTYNRSNLICSRRCIGAHSLTQNRAAKTLIASLVSSFRLFWSHLRNDGAPCT